MYTEEGAVLIERVWKARSRYDHAKVVFEPYPVPQFRTTTKGKGSVPNGPSRT